MFRGVSEKTNWRAVIIGWAIAIATGIVLNLLFEAAHVLLFGGNVLNPDNLTTALVALSLLSGFLAHFAAGLFLIEGGVALPALTLGFAGGALLASLALLALNLVGGFFGGKLGEWETGPVNTSGGPDPLRGRTR